MAAIRVLVANGVRRRAGSLLGLADSLHVALPMPGRHDPGWKSRGFQRGDRPVVHRGRLIGGGGEAFLPEELYSQRRVVLSPDVVAPFDCTPPHPPPDDALTLEQRTAVFFPADCSSDPVFYSLRVSADELQQR